MFRYAETARVNAGRHAISYSRERRPSAWERTAVKGQRVVLASRPVGPPVAENFRLEEMLLPSPRPGQVRLSVHSASIDPYMRTKMSAAASYTPPYEIGSVISSRTVCRVEESLDPRFSAGDMVAAFTGWQSHAVAEGADLSPVDLSLAPPAAFLGVLGMPGFTAYSGLEKIGRPVEGETLVVAAALGPVGATVAQMAKLRGLHVVAIAGGPAKTAILREEFGLDMVLDHGSPDFEQQLERATPHGVDIYFENVGGRVADAVYPRMNIHGRVPLCGMIADYNGQTATTGSDRLPALYRHILNKSLSVRGFLSREFEDDLHETFLADMGSWVRQGSIVHREDVTVGLENAPATFIGLLRGGNVGKAVVQVARGPEASSPR